MHVDAGILMMGKLSVGWNFHPARTMRTVALPLAVSLAADRVLVTVGPVTFIWLYA